MQKYKTQLLSEKKFRVFSKVSPRRYKSGLIFNQLFQQTVSMGNLCGTDVYSKLLKEYGDQFVKLIAAEKAKEAVNTKVVEAKGQVDGFFNNFLTQSNQQIDLKTGILRGQFENVKSQINSRIPGGLAFIEQAQGKPIDQILGFNDIMARVDGLKGQANTLVNQKHQQAGTLLEGTRTNTINRIDAQKPQIPIFSRLPNFLQAEILKRGEQEFRKDIESQNSKILNVLGPELALSRFQSLLGGFNPGLKMDELLALAQGNFGQKMQALLGLGGVGNAGGIGNAIGNLGIGGLGNLGGFAKNLGF